MVCEICRIINKEIKSRIIYRDKLVVAFMPENRFNKYHIILAPIAHVPIFDVIPDELASHLFIIANNISKSVAKTFNINSDNILLNNGIPAGQKYPHLIIDIIPRIPEDKVDLNWTPKPVNNDLLAKLALNVRGLCMNIVEDLKETPAKEEIVENTVLENNEDEDDYLLDTINRKP